jgi:hypothetical protein
MGMRRHIKIKMINNKNKFKFPLLYVTFFREMNSIRHKERWRYDTCSEIIIAAFSLSSFWCFSHAAETTAPRLSASTMAAAVITAAIHSDILISV